MKIKENLVFDKYTGNLIGFIDLGDTDINTLNSEKKKPRYACTGVSCQGCYFRFKVLLSIFCY